MFWEAQIKPTHIEWFFRGFVPFFWLLLLAKVMGQRLMGRLTLFDFIIAISIGSVMASIMGNPKENLLSGFILTGAFALGNVLLSFLVLHFGKLRRLVQGEPLVLIKDGRILDDVLRSNRVTLDDLLVSLRLNSIANPLDVEYAIMEPNGQISVMPKSQQRPVRPADLGLKTGYEGMPTLLILDGNVLEDNLRENGLDMEWLMSELAKYGVGRADEVFAVTLDTVGRLYVSKKIHVVPSYGKD